MIFRRSPPSCRPPRRAGATPPAPTC